MHSSHPRPTRSRTLAAAALVVVSLTAGGCGGGSSAPAAGPTDAPSSGGAAPPVASTVVLGRVAGNLHQPYQRVFAHHRRQVLADVGKAVDSWLDGGFVGVSYPRDTFGSAFGAFTASARHDAEGQKRLMTNWTLRRHIDGVDVHRRKVTVDVLAPHGRPAGATARVSLVFTTTGHTRQRVTLHGRVFLSPNAQGHWQIFGFDVARGGR